MPRIKSNRPQEPFYKRHSLSLVAACVLLTWFVLYLFADPQSHSGAFFGNAIADWIGLLMTVLVTKWFFERGSRQSREPDHRYRSRILEFLHEHSLTIFLLLSGIGWIVLYTELDPQSKWGTVLSNIVSEWSQQIGLVILTKKLIEAGSKE